MNAASTSFLVFLPGLCFSRKYSRRRGLCDTSMDLCNSWPARDDHQGLVKLNNYIARARNRILSAASMESPKDIHVFIGNESADLDSVVSTLVLAFYADLKGMPSAPVVNCPRSDIALRGDIAAIITVVGIDVDKMVFMDEVLELGTITEKITLVDHNEVAPQQAALSSKVIAVVDHHDDGGRFCDARPRVIEACGSCATLVFELCPLVVDETKGNRTLAGLLLCAILMDTQNMDAFTGKGTLRDADAVSALSNYLHVSAEAQTNLFASLAAKKQDQGHLSTRDLLRRDYKQFEAGDTAVGIASVGISLSTWVNRCSSKEKGLSADILRSFCAEKQIVCLMIMSSFTNSVGVFCRELALCSRSSECSRLAEYVGKALSSMS
jgi:exopolyphosphatase